VLLTHQGQIKPLDIKARGLSFSGEIVVISRQKCVFAAFKAPLGLTGRAALAAARVFAANGSPYRESGVLISRRANQFGVWWWDNQWAAQALQDAGYKTDRPILPEPFFRQAGRGVQIIRAGDGYECQFWDKGFLLADQWARSAPDRDSWGDFLRLAGQEVSPIPPVTISPYVSSNPYLQSVVSDYSVKTLGRLAAGLAVGLMLGTSVFFLGQAANYSLQARALDKKLAALGAQDQSGAQAARAQIQGLNTLKRDLDQADPMSTLQAAQTLLTPFGYKLSRFAVDSQRVSFDLPTEASAGVDLLTEELEASPYFSQVEPVLDKARNRLVFTMTIEAKPESPTS
jgi:hypothetical protein